MSFCTKCGKDNDETALYCKHCGNSLVDTTIQKSSISSKKLIKISIVIVAVIVCIYLFPLLEQILYNILYSPPKLTKERVEEFYTEKQSIGSLDYVYETTSGFFQISFTNDEIYSLESWNRVRDLSEQMAINLAKQGNNIFSLEGYEYKGIEVRIYYKIEGMAEMYAKGTIYSEQ